MMSSRLLQRAVPRDLPAAALESVRQSLDVHKVRASVTKEPANVPSFVFLPPIFMRGSRDD
jgi:hypothetical protein